MEQVYSGQVSGLRDLTILVITKLDHQLVYDFRILRKSKSAPSDARGEAKVRQRWCHDMECWVIVIPIQ